MTRFLPYAVFAAGLAVVGWVAVGYVGANPLALAVTALVAAFYLMGALELRRFQQATDTLSRAVAELSEAPASLGAWLSRLPASLQNAVRLRIEGERVGLPGPALTPYLAGFLVLLGMLGTFLGMVVTLNGTGLALDSATDLQAVRSSLSAPVKGLGLAFGTSVAGVAASAMLGLMSALCRRERLQAGQLLDSKIATTLRVFSQVHQREESFKLLQQQALAMPELVGQLQAMMAALAQQSQAQNDRLISSQDSFHGKAEAVYAGLATSVDQSLRQSLTESARIAGAAIQPVVEATMAAIARETAALHGTLSQTVQQQLEGLSSRFAATTAGVADTWQAALAEHRQTSEALSGEVRGSHDRFAETFAQRSAALVDNVAAQLERTVGSVSHTWSGALAEHQRVSEKLSADSQQALTAAAAAFEQHSASLLRTVGQAHAELQTDIAARDEQRLAVWTQSLAAMAAALKEEWQQAGTYAAGQQQHLLDTISQVSSRDEQKLAAWTQSLAAMAAALKEEWQQAGVHATGRQQQLLDSIAQISSRDEQRLSAWTQSLASMADSLKEEWQQAGAQSASRQHELLEQVAQTAREMSSQTDAHAKATVAEIAQLLQAASEAPRAAAEVVAELRQKLSDSMARDNAMLEERSRILETLSTLLDAVNHASTEQRAAVDSLVAASAEVLERVGGRFTEQVEAETGKMTGIAAQITGGAAEVASMGEAFGLAVQLFSQSNDKMGAQLQRIEAALGKSIARSDEQLAYYVAQAREVIDLSIMSQKQIVEDLQQLASRQAAVGSEA
jgi:membrane associated rhomboid family serine protease